MARIKRLPDALINQIAAGEVVQRPASVLKELLENAIDAQATAIQVHIKDAGKTLIQVKDNGIGMDPLDAKLCFERHTTSKIEKIDDLFNIHTMGFRGEALASIASVSKVTLITQPENQEVGTQIEIEGGKFLSNQPTFWGKGTLIQVKNLFYNVPARRKFLKTNAVEYKHLLNEFLHIALAHPDKAFEFYSNDHLQFALNPKPLKNRILDIFTQWNEEQLLLVNEETPNIGIKGYVGSPETASTTRGDQYLFVNHRFIRSNFLNHAIFSCYENLIPKGEFPFFVLFIQIHPSEIDVNIHPTKTEIKFENENFVYSILNAVIRKALAKFHVEELEWDAFQNAVQQQKKHLESDVTIKQYKEKNIPKTGEEDLEKSLYRLYQPLQTSPKTLNPLFSSETKAPSWTAFQVYQRFIVTNFEGNLWVFPQQNAHWRILFEKYLPIVQKGLHTQQMLYPERIFFSTTDYWLFSENQEVFHKLGLDFELDKDSALVKGSPVELKIPNLKNFIFHVLDSIKLLDQFVPNHHEELVKTIIKPISIAKEQPLLEEEIRNLVQDLFRCENKFYDPFGNPILMEWKAEELSKWFG